MRLKSAIIILLLAANSAAGMSFKEWVERVSRFHTQVYEGDKILLRFQKDLRVSDYFPHAGYFWKHWYLDFETEVISNFSLNYSRVNFPCHIKWENEKFEIDYNLNQKSVETSYLLYSLSSGQLLVGLKKFADKDLRVTLGIEYDVSRYFSFTLPLAPNQEKEFNEKISNLANDFIERLSSPFK